jgi:hypothetical protein
MGRDEAKRRFVLFFLLFREGGDRDAREFSRCHLVGQKEGKGREGEENQEQRAKSKVKRERGAKRFLGLAGGPHCTLLIVVSQVGVKSRQEPGVRRPIESVQKVDRMSNNNMTVMIGMINCPQ